MADLYFSRTTSVFVLHGNTYDLTPLADVDAPDRAPFGSIPEFLAEQLFARWDIVLHYDLGRGLRVFPGRNEKRLKDMVALATKRIGDLSTVKNDPAIVITYPERDNQQRKDTGHDVLHHRQPDAKVATVVWVKRSCTHCRMPNVECRMSNVECRMPNVECRVLSAEC